MSVFLPQFPGTPFDDVIVMGEDKNCVVKNDGGNNKYIIYLSDERSFTHTITDDSPTLGQIYLVKYITRGQRNSTSHYKEVAYDEETENIGDLLERQERQTYEHWKDHIETNKTWKCKPNEAVFVRRRSHLGK